MINAHTTEVTHQMGYFMEWVTSGLRRFSTPASFPGKVGYFMGYFTHAWWVTSVRSSVVQKGSKNDTWDIYPHHPSICPSTYLPIYPSIQSSLDLSTKRSSYLPIHLSILLSTHLSIHPSIHLAIYLPTYLAVQLPTHPSVHLLIDPSTHLSIYPSSYLTTYPLPILLSTHLSIHPSIVAVRHSKECHTLRGPPGLNFIFHVWWFFVVPISIFEWVCGWFCVTQSRIFVWVCMFGSVSRRCLTPTGDFRRGAIDPSAHLPIYPIISLPIYQAI